MVRNGASCALKRDKFGELCAQPGHCTRDRAGRARLCSRKMGADRLEQVGSSKLSDRHRRLLRLGLWLSVPASSCRAWRAETGRVEARGLEPCSPLSQRGQGRARGRSRYVSAPRSPQAAHIVMDGCFHSYSYSHIRSTRACDSACDSVVSAHPASACRRGSRRKPRRRRGQIESTY